MTDFRFYDKDNKLHRFNCTKGDNPCTIQSILEVLNREDVRLCSAMMGITYAEVQIANDTYIFDFGD